MKNTILLLVSLISLSAMAQPEVNLAWEPSSPEVAEVRLFRNGALLAILYPSQNTYVDFAVEAGRRYYYQVLHLHKDEKYISLGDPFAATAVNYLTDGHGGYLLDGDGNRLVAN